jgi:PDZ domain-containing secreted protein
MSKTKTKNVVNVVENDFLEEIKSQENQRKESEKVYQMQVFDKLTSLKLIDSSQLAEYRKYVESGEITLPTLRDALVRQAEKKNFKKEDKEAIKKAFYKRSATTGSSKTNAYELAGRSIAKGNFKELNEVLKYEGIEVDAKTKTVTCAKPTGKGEIVKVIFSIGDDGLVKQNGKIVPCNICGANLARFILASGLIR